MTAPKIPEPAPPPAPPPADDASVAVPAMFACVGMGIGAIAFGAGYGARSYFSTAAYKELVEKFPDLPTAEAEAAARKGATRAFLGGTALCGASHGTYGFMSQIGVPWHRSNAEMCIFRFLASTASTFTSERPTGTALCGALVASHPTFAP